MLSSTLLALAMTCAPQVHPDTLRALVRVESQANPWAIGLIGGVLEHQPRNRAEALATARSLQSSGWNFDLGLAQINLKNLSRLGLTLDTAFDACTNLTAMQTVLAECFARAGRSPSGAPRVPDQAVLRRALSCYCSGNFTTGFRLGYVRRVVAAARSQRPLAQTLPR